MKKLPKDVAKKLDDMACAFRQKVFDLIHEQAANDTCFVDWDDDCKTFDRIYKQYHDQGWKVVLKAFEGWM